jgi:hypothetical protein
MGSGGRRKRKAVTAAEKLAARREALRALERDLQSGRGMTFEQQAKVNPVLGWMASVPTVDAVQEKKRQQELLRAKKRGVHPELEAYLRAPPQPKDSDPLQWWASTGEKAYPNLARAAKDFLAVPATRAAAERNFSEGRQMVSWTRHQLRDQMIEANMCLKSWFKYM